MDYLLLKYILYFLEFMYSKIAEYNDSVIFCFQFETAVDWYVPKGPGRKTLCFWELAKDCPMWVCLAYGF